MFRIIFIFIVLLFIIITVLGIDIGIGIAIVMLISPRSAVVIGDSLELSPQPIVENDHFVNAEHRRGTSYLPGELSLQFSRLGVGDDTSRYGDRHRRIRPGLTGRG